MSGQWKPGDMAFVPTDEGNLRCFFSGEDWVSADGRCFSPRSHVIGDPRPLVVIDPEDSEQVERLHQHIFDLRAAGALGRNALTFDTTRAALRKFANPKPPKPDEPMGLGAVVEDSDGRHWTRYDTKGDPQPWWCDGPGPDVPVERRDSWDDIDAVRVLSEGVPA